MRSPPFNGARHAYSTLPLGDRIDTREPFFSSLLDPSYLYRWFSSVNVQRRVRSFGNQTTNISNLDHKRTLKLQIPLPPLAEQKRIAGILDAADALRAKRRESLSQLDTLLQSTFLDMFDDPVTNPMGWEVTRLNDVAEFHAGSTLPVGKEYTGQVAGYLHLKVSELNDPENTPTVQRSRMWSVTRGKGIAAGMSQAPLKKGDGDPTSIVCRSQSTGMEDHRHEQESQNRDK